MQALRAYVHAAEPEALRAQLGVGGADLAQLLPELREILPGLPEPPALESESARFRLFDAATAFLRNASAGCPIVLVLDDLHAADEPSLLLLRFFAREIGSTHLLLLGALRNVDPIGIVVEEQIGHDTFQRRMGLRRRVDGVADIDQLSLHPAWCRVMQARVAGTNSITARSASPVVSKPASRQR